MKIEQIKKLIEATPNDFELGNKIRELYRNSTSINEVNVDPNQIDLEDMIKEIKQHGK